MNRNRTRGRLDVERIVCRIAGFTNPLGRFAAWWRWCLRHGGNCGTDQQQSRFARMDSIQGLLAGCISDAERLDLLTRQAGKYASQSVTRDNAPLAPAAASGQAVGGDGA